MQCGKWKSQASTCRMHSGAWRCRRGLLGDIDTLHNLGGGGCDKVCHPGRSRRSEIFWRVANVVEGLHQASGPFRASGPSLPDRRSASRGNSWGLPQGEAPTLQGRGCAGPARSPLSLCNAHVRSMQGGGAQVRPVRPPSSRKSCPTAASGLQVHEHGILLQLLQELVGTLLLLGDVDLVVHVFAVAGARGDEPPHDDVLLEAAKLVQLAP